MATLTYTFDTLKVAILANTEEQAGSAFETELPNMIGRAERICYRALDLEIFDTEDGSKSTTIGDPELAAPDNSLVVRSVRLGTNPLVRRTRTMVRNYLDEVSAQGVPLYFAQVSTSLLIVAPRPDAIYAANQVANVLPAGLSDSNTTTVLSLHAADLLFWATMVEARTFQQAVDGEADLALSKANFTEALTVAKMVDWQRVKRVDYL